MEILKILIWGVLGLGILAFAGTYLIPVKAMIRVKESELDIPFGDLLTMNLSKSPVDLILDAFEELKKAKIDVSIIQLDTHHKAGGRIEELTEALVFAKSNGVGYNFFKFAELDLAGQDILKLVKSSTEERTLTFPRDADGWKSFRLMVSGQTVKVRVEVNFVLNLNRYADGRGMNQLFLRLEKALTNAAAEFKNQTVLYSQIPNELKIMIEQKPLDSGLKYSIRSIRVFHADPDEEKKGFGGDDNSEDGESFDLGGTEPVFGL